MAVNLSDAEIAAHLTAPKPALRAMQMRQRLGHLGQTQTVTTAGGDEYRVIVRQSVYDPDDFSIIVAWRPPQATELFHLRRYNGKTHHHDNPIERTSFRGCYHVHQATERYQSRGGDAEHYAETTTEYSNLEGAWRLMERECCFGQSQSVQLRLPDTDD